MVEPDFTALRDRLASEVQQPPFTAIRARRRRRTARLAGGGAAVVVTALLAGMAVTLLPGQPHNPEPAATAPGQRSGLSPRVAALAGTPSKLLFALTKCLHGCADNRGGFTLLRSTDLGRSWTPVSLVPGTDATGDGRLYAADDARLLVITSSAATWSTDGGQTWRAPWPLPSGHGGSGFGPAAAAGGRLWLVYDGRIYGMTDTGGFQPAPASPARVRYLSPTGDGLVALDGTGTWNETVDAGAHWTPMGDPCAGTAVPGSLFSTQVYGPEGTRWAVCARQPATGNQPKELVYSTDGGRNWHSHGALESAGYATDLYPMSPTVAWRTGARADIYRSDDATQWTDVAATGGRGGPVAFIALDANTALYYDGDKTDTIVGHLTRDGGRTWTALPFQP